MRGIIYEEYLNMSIYDDVSCWMSKFTWIKFKTDTKDEIKQEEISDKKETKTNTDKKDGETKDVEKSKNTTNQTKVKTSSNEQSSSKSKPIESEVDKKAK